MLRLLPIYIDDDESDGGCWSAVCLTICTVLSLAWKKLRAVFNHPDDGVRLSVEETEPERIQSSVRPFYSDYDTYDLQDSYDEAEDADVSQPDIILQHEEERGHLLARSLDESSEVNNYTGGCWTSVCSAVRRFTPWKRIRNLFMRRGDDVRQSEEETSQTSVQPFSTNFRTYDVLDSV